MNARRTLRGLFTLATLLCPLDAAEGQSQLAPRVSELTVLGITPTITLRPEPILPQAQPIRAREGSMGTSMALAAIGSAVGLFGGAYAGYAVAEGAGEGSWGSIFLGAGVGSFLGAGLAGSTTAKSPRGAFIGSLLGVVAGAVVAGAVNDPGGVSPLLGYSITHGVVTGLFGGMGR